MTTLLKALYKQLADIPVVTDYNPKFRYWHVEGLLLQGTQLLQRIVDERSEYFNVLAQRAALLDQRAKEGNEEASNKDRLAKGIRFREREALQSEVTVRSNLQYDRVRTMAEQLYAKEVNERNDAWIATSIIDRSINNFLTESAAKRLEGTDEENEINSSFNTAEEARLAVRKSDTTDQFFDDRLKSLITRIGADYKRATDRLIQASVGLEVIFWYDKPLSSALNPTDVDVRNGWNAVDALVDWTREANGWIAQFAENDQYYTKSISLRAHMGDFAFKKALSANEGNVAKLVFNLPLTEFRQSYVRLRGLTVYAEYQPRDDMVLEARVRVPTQALSRQFDGSVKILDQAEFPSVQLGSISYRGSNVAPEVAGSISIGNASPICADLSNLWKVEISDPRRVRELSTIEDVEVELHLAAVPLD
jgi:hypothetical protein